MRKEGKGGADQPPVLPSPLPSLTPSTSTNIKTWKKYLIGEGLVSQERLKRDIIPFPIKADQAREYQRNLENNVSNLKNTLLKGLIYKL